MPPAQPSVVRPAPPRVPRGQSRPCPFRAAVGKKPRKGRVLAERRVQCLGEADEGRLLVPEGDSSGD